MATQPSLGNPMPMDEYISGTTGQAYKNWQNQDTQLQWARDQFAKNQGTAGTVQAGDLATQDAMNRAATEDRALYTGTYVPAMKKQMDYALDYTTPERMAANRAGAMATSQIADNAGRQAAEMQLQSVGVDPSVGRFAGLDAGLHANAAAKAAAAGTQSDRQTEMLGQQYLANAIATGQVLPGQAVNEAGLGVGAGNAAVNTGLATTASGSATMGTPLQWNAQGNDMFKQWLPAATAQTQAGLTQNKNTADEMLAQEKLNQSSSSGIGAVIGAASGLLGGVGKLAGGLGGVDGISNMFGSSGDGVTAASPNSLGGSGSGSTPFATSGADLNSSGGLGGLPGGLAAKGGMIKKFTGGGVLHDIVHTAAPLANFIFPGLGILAQGAGDALTDTISGQTDQIGPDLASDFTLGADKDGKWGLPNLPGLGGLGKQLGIGGGAAGGAGVAGSQATDAASWGSAGSAATDAGSWAGDAGNVTDAAAFFARGGEAGMPSNMVKPEQSPSRGAQTDDVHALLNEGEFVVPKDVASWLGEKFLQNLINKSRTEAAGPKAEPEEAPMPQAMALSPPSFTSEGARNGGMI